MDKKVLVLFSGGIDSTVCLVEAIKRYGEKNVTAICIDYGQKNIKELESCRKIAEYYKINYLVLYMANLFSTAINCSMMRISKIDIPKISYKEQTEKISQNDNVSTNVPYRNGLMLSACASYAIANGYSEIYYGIHLEDDIARNFYPDCNEDFNMAINLAIYIGSGKKVKIIAPLLNLTKKEIIKLGMELEVPFNLTWTCYEDTQIACGKCCACKDRIKGFEENNIKDSIIYQEV